jgi:hypothetical protein
MCDPPAAPITSLIRLSLLTMMEGDMEDRGRLPGFIKLAGDGLIPYLFVMFGEEKSSISLLNIIPVLDPRIPDANLYYKYKLILYTFS